ncbi:hypothetical protein NHX12_019128, partial [Muraenolepis orangiensis]
LIGERRQSSAQRGWDQLNVLLVETSARVNTETSSRPGGTASIATTTLDHHRHRQTLRTRETAEVCLNETAFHTPRRAETGGQERVKEGAAGRRTASSRRRSVQRHRTPPGTQNG